MVLNSPGLHVPIIYLPIFYNRVMGWRIETCFWSGLNSQSEYNQVSSGLYAVLKIHVIIEGHFNWKFIVSVGCWIWWSFVDIECEGEVAEFHWKITLQIGQSFSCIQNHIERVDSVRYVWSDQLHLKVSNRVTCCQTLCVSQWSDVKS